MNPVKINKLIKSKNSVCIDELSELYGSHLSHKYFKFSKDMFYCEHCGLERHQVEKITLYGWFKLPFYEN